MRTFKLIDCGIQALLAGFCIISFFIRRPEEVTLIAYAIAASGTLISCLIHLTLRYGQQRTSRRSRYQRNMLLILAIGVGCWGLMGVFDFFMAGLYIIFPITAFIYVSVCMKETFPDLKITYHEQ